MEIRGNLVRELYRIDGCCFRWWGWDNEARMGFREFWASLVVGLLWSEEEIREYALPIFFAYVYETMLSVIKCCVGAN